MAVCGHKPPSALMPQTGHSMARIKLRREGVCLTGLSARLLFMGEVCIYSNYLTCSTPANPCAVRCLPADIDPRGLRSVQLVLEKGEKGSYLFLPFHVVCAAPPNEITRHAFKCSHRHLRAAQMSVLFPLSFTTVVTKLMSTVKTTLPTYSVVDGPAGTSVGKRIRMLWPVSF